MRVRSFIATHRVNSQYHPFPRPAAFQNRFAQLHLVMAVGCSGEKNRRSSSAGNVLIDGAIVHLVAVGETFGMPAGVISEASDVLTEASRGALEHLIRFVA